MLFKNFLICIGVCELLVLQLELLLLLFLTMLAIVGLKLLFFLDILTIFSLLSVEWSLKIWGGGVRGNGGGFKSDSVRYNVFMLLTDRASKFEVSWFVLLNVLFVSDQLEMSSETGDFISFKGFCELWNRLRKK